VPFDLEDEVIGQAEVIESLAERFDILRIDTLMAESV
jgi:hypothetical protein